MSATDVWYPPDRRPHQPDRRPAHPGHHRAAAARAPRSASSRSAAPRPKPDRRHPPAIPHDIMQGRDDRLLVGHRPCSIHDPGPPRWTTRAACSRCAAASSATTLEIVMRSTSKPRTTVGWKGPDQRPPTWTRATASTRACASRARLLIDINRLGLPAGSEFLDVDISPQYIGDLISLGRDRRAATESQVHRHLEVWPPGHPKRRSASRTAPTATSKIATDAIQAGLPSARPPFPCRCTRTARSRSCSLTKATTPPWTAT